MEYHTMTEARSILPLSGEDGVENLAQGLEWVQWLLSGVRQKAGGVLLEQAERWSDVSAEWQWLLHFIKHNGGDWLLEGVKCAAARDMAGMQALEAKWASALAAERADRSVSAGRWLLNSMKGAHHSGMVHRISVAVSEGALQGHFGVVWATVGHLFQLSDAAGRKGRGSIVRLCARRWRVK